MARSSFFQPGPQRTDLDQPRKEHVIPDSKLESSVLQSAWNEGTAACSALAFRHGRHVRAHLASRWQPMLIRDAFARACRVGTTPRTAHTSRGIGALTDVRCGSVAFAPALGPCHAPHTRLEATPIGLSFGAKRCRLDRLSAGLQPERLFVDVGRAEERRDVPVTKQNTAHTVRSDASFTLSPPQPLRVRCNAASLCGTGGWGAAAY